MIGKEKDSPGLFLLIESSGVRRNISAINRDNGHRGVEIGDKSEGYGDGGLFSS